MHKCVVIALWIVCSSLAVAGDFKDPTRPWQPPVTESVAVAKQSIFVNAIFVSDRRKLAIIDGERVRVGEKIHGAIVRGIARNEVTLEVNGRNVVAMIGQRTSL